jgi:hypothetical protein
MGKIDLDLEALSKLEAEASPGPWRAGRPDTVSYGVENVAYKNVYGTETEKHPRTGDDIPLEVARAEGENCIQDALLIAAARNTLPALLEKAKRLDELESALHFLQRASPISTSDYEPAALLLLAKQLGWSPKGGQGE